MKLLGINEFLPNNKLFDLVGKLVCEESSPFNAVCSNILFLICGYDSQQLNEVNNFMD